MRWFGLVMLRRSLIRSLILAPALLAAPAIARAVGLRGRIGGGSAGTGVMRAFDFTQKFGVNTNLNAGDTLANIYTDLSYLGIYNIRDSIWGGSNYPQASVWAPYFAHFAALGIKARAHFGYQGSVAGGNSYPMASWISELKSNIVTPYPGQVVGVAGPNEPDNAAGNGGFLYTDGSGGATPALAIPAATTAQNALYTAMKADPALAQIPVDEWPSAFSFSGNFAGTYGYRVDMTSFTDRQNMHDYYSADMTNQPTFPANGAIYSALFDTSHGYLRNDSQFCFHGTTYPSGGRFITTETGWFQPWTSGSPNFASLANDRAKTRLILCDLFDHASQPQCDGVYIYKLRDNGWGLINLAGAPLGAGVAVKNVMLLIADPGAAAASFGTSKLGYSLSGMPAQGGNAVVQKSNGNFEIILWNETTFFNASTGADVSVTSSSVTVTLPRVMSGSVFDPVNSGTAPVSAFSGVSSVNVSLNDAPLIVEARDGDKIIVGQPGGGAVPTSMSTPYGTVALGDAVSPQPGYGGGTFCYGLLNGKEMAPYANASISVFGLPIWQQLRLVDFGAGPQICGIANDQIWYQWVNYSWQTNDGMDLSSGPAPTGNGLLPPPLPTYAPPYTPSGENSTITGGTGTLTTADGIFSFGPGSVGTGWRLMLNGIPIAVNGTSFATYQLVDMMTVYGHGQLFFRMYSDSTWRCWTGNQPNASTGPTASPVPVGMNLTPPRPQVAASSPVHTHLGTVSVVMSDGSGFSGTITLGDTTNFEIVGANIQNAISPWATSITSLTVAKNGTSYTKEIIIVAL